MLRTIFILLIRLFRILFFLLLCLINSFFGTFEKTQLQIEHFLEHLAKWHCFFLTYVISFRYLLPFFLKIYLLKDIYKLEFVTLSVDSPRPRHRAGPAQSSAIFHDPKVHIPPSAGSADTQCGRSVCLLPAP